MTMTEPSPQIAEEPVHSKTANGVENSETHVQEVNNDGLGGESGGVSNDQENSCQNKDPSSETCDNHKQSKRNKGKSVKFPDGGFVAGYDEPKDPWKNAEKWTTEDLVSAYRKSCEKHGTKPLPRLIQQLQKITCNGKRHDSLILKGEKLDQKHCECFEEIFKRVQFRHIDLEASHLDDECAVALFDMIEYYCSACQLNISFNKNISIRGWQSCSRLIRRTPSLTFLDMRNCDLNERSIPIMGRALKLGSHLTILHLENIYLSGRPLVILVAALKMNENLLELFLADNKLMPSDGIQLGILMKYNHKLELLDLRNNHLQDVGTRHLCDGLAEQVQDRGLLTLVLWNNQITYQGMTSLANCLMLVQNLETLNLGHNSITNEGIHQLKEGLLKNKSLLRLGLPGTKITCEGAVALAEYVADSNKLLRLDLRENDIKTAGLMGLSLALRMNETVTRIDLDKDTKKESGVKDYADQQRRLQQEIVWYQERNQVRVLEREEEERRRLEERAQQEAELRQAAEALKEAQLAEEDMAYIPSLDKIQRPKLLFSTDQTPQHTLESPGVVANAQNTPEEKKTVVGIGSPGIVSPPPASFLSPPPADLLLSPQYCPELTAKKIFTVSRVSDTSHVVAVESPAACVDVNASLDEPHLLLSPGTLCQNVASESMNEYIEQIVSEASKDEDELRSSESMNEYIEKIVSEASKDSEEELRISETMNENIEPEQRGSESESINQCIEQIVSDASKDSEEELRSSSSQESSGPSGGVPKNDGQSFQENPLCSDSDPTASGTLIPEVANDKEEHASDKQDNSPSIDAGDESKELVKEVNSGSDSSTDTVSKGDALLDGVEESYPKIRESVELSDSIVAELSARPEEEEGGEENSSLTFDMLNSLDNPKYGDRTDSDINALARDKNLNFEKTLENGLEREREKELSEKQKSETVPSTDNVDAINSSEQWLKIDSVDLVQQNKLNAKTVLDKSKPDFHTNYTMNGLTEELASALDISEEPSDPTSVGDKTVTGTLQEPASGDHSSAMEDKIPL